MPKQKSETAFQYNPPPPRHEPKVDEEDETCHGGYDKQLNMDMTMGIRIGERLQIYMGEVLMIPKMRRDSTAVSLFGNRVQVITK